MGESKARVRNRGERKKKAGEGYAMRRGNLSQPRPARASNSRSTRGDWPSSPTAPTGCRPVLADRIGKERKGSARGYEHRAAPPRLAPPLRCLPPPPVERPATSPGTKQQPGGAAPPRALAYPPT